MVLARIPARIEQGVAGGWRSAQNRARPGYVKNMARAKTECLIKEYLLEFYKTMFLKTLFL